MSMANSKLRWQWSMRNRGELSSRSASTASASWVCRCVGSAWPTIVGSWRGISTSFGVRDAVMLERIPVAGPVAGKTMMGYFRPMAVRRVVTVAKDGGLLLDVATLLPDFHYLGIDRHRHRLVIAGSKP